MYAWLEFLYGQLFVTPTPPTKSYDGQTVIVTGANGGLGLETARHLVALGAQKVILAVRSLDKGEDAKASIVKSTTLANAGSVIEVWHLDLSNYDSVIRFAERAKNLPRLDVIIENAAIVTLTFRKAEEDESTITTNVISTFLLALLMLPKLRETAMRYGVQTHLVVVSSDAHKFVTFPEGKSDRVFDQLNDQPSARMDSRYGVSKLLEVLLVRKLGSVTHPVGKPLKVIINTLNPGMCDTGIAHELEGFKDVFWRILLKIFARTPEVGSRTLMAAVEAGEESHGQYMDNGGNHPASPFVRSAEGAKVGEKVWGELLQKLEHIRPGIMANVHDEDD